MAIEMQTGPDLRLRRTAMNVTQTQLAERIGATKSWISRRESLAIVRADDASRYLSGLATFGAIPTVTVKVA